METATGLINLIDTCKRGQSLCTEGANFVLDGIVFGSDDFCADIGLYTCNTLATPSINYACLRYDLNMHVQVPAELLMPWSWCMRDSTWWQWPRPSLCKPLIWYTLTIKVMREDLQWPKIYYDHHNAVINAYTSWMFLQTLMAWGGSHWRAPAWVTQGNRSFTPVRFKLCRRLSNPQLNVWSGPQNSSMLLMSIRNLERWAFLTKAVFLSTHSWLLIQLIPHIVIL